MVEYTATLYQTTGKLSVTGNKTDVRGRHRKRHQEEAPLLQGNPATRGNREAVFPGGRGTDGDHIKFKDIETGGTHRGGHHIPEDMDIRRYGEGQGRVAEIVN